MAGRLAYICIPRASESLRVSLAAQVLFLAEKGPDHVMLSEQEEKTNMNICWHRRASLCCHRS